MRRLNRYVEEQAPWALAKDDANAAQLDLVLATLADGLRLIGVPCTSWLPAMEKLFAAIGVEDLALSTARLQPRPRPLRGADRAVVPQAPGLT